MLVGTLSKAKWWGRSSVWTPLLTVSVLFGSADVYEIVFPG